MGTSSNTPRCRRAADLQASPCRHGHSTLRCSANGNCVECHEGGNAGLRAHGLLAETAAILRNILSAVYYPQEFDALGSRMLGEEGAW